MRKRLLALFLSLSCSMTSLSALASFPASTAYAAEVVNEYSADDLTDENGMITYEDGDELPYSEGMGAVEDDSSVSEGEAADDSEQVTVEPDEETADDISIDDTDKVADGSSDEDDANAEFTSVSDNSLGQGERLPGGDYLEYLGDGNYRYTDFDDNEWDLTSDDPEFQKYYGDRINEDGTVKIASVQRADKSTDLFAAQSALGDFSSGFGTTEALRNRSHTNGIDVSKHQGNINWGQLKNLGVDFAIIRAGYRGTDQGSLNPDEKYAANISGARSAGVRVGVYFFSQAVNVSEAVQEADFMCGLTENTATDLPYFIDFEYSGNGRLAKAKLNAQQQTEIVNAFCARVKANGHAAGVYANKSMLNSGLMATSIPAEYKIWLAHFTQNTDYTGRFDLWQYSSRCEAFGGAISSQYCDVNFLYGPSFTAKINNTKLSLSADRQVTVSGKKYPAKAMITPTISGGKLSEFTITHKSSNVAVATTSTVTNGVEVNPKGIGEAKITISAVYNKTGEKFEKSFKVYVYDKLTSDKIVFKDKRRFEYDGTSRNPSAIVDFTKISDSHLKKVIEDNITLNFVDSKGNKKSSVKNVGKYKLLVKGKNYLVGSLTLPTGSEAWALEILPRNLKYHYDYDDVKVKREDNMEYSNNLEAVFTITDYLKVDGKFKNVELKYGVDYKFDDNNCYTTFEKNEKGEMICTIYAAVEGIGNYCDTIPDLTAVMTPGAISADMVVKIPDFIYNGKALTKADIENVIKVYDAGKELKLGEDYVVNDDLKPVYADTVNGNPGQYQISITGLENKGFNGNALIVFNIAPKSLAGSGITVEPVQNYTYTGLAIEPDDIVIKAQLADETVTLNEGVDYKLSFTKNIKCGTAQFTATGIGKYKGTVKGSFIIEANDIDNVSVDHGNEQIIGAAPEGEETGESSLEIQYTGKALKPSFALYFDGRKLPTSLYTVKYENNVQAGLAKVTLTGKSQYKGSRSFTFRILPKDISLSKGMKYGLISKAAYKSGAGISALPEVTYNGKKLSIKSGSDEAQLRIRYIKNEDYVGSTASAAELWDAAVDTVVDAGSYNAIIRGNGNYTGFYVYTKAFSVSRKNLDSKMLILRESIYAYSGEELTAKLELVDGNNTLVKDTDYTVSYKLKGSKESAASVTAPGKYELLVTGVGNYKGSIKSAIQVYDGSKTILTDSNTEPVWVKDADSIYYTGKKVTPLKSLIVDGRELRAGKDYSASYKNNKKAGNATVTITGKGNYVGSVTKSFVIKVNNLNDLDNPGYDEVLPDGVSLVGHTRLAAGQKPGKVKIEHRVNGLKLQLTAPKWYYTYNGKAQKPSVKVKYNGKKLAPKKDYSISYEYNNAGEWVGASSAKKAGDYRAVIDFSAGSLGNFDGKYYLNYKIAQADLNSLTVSVPKQQYLAGEDVSLTMADLSFKLGKVKLSIADLEGVDIASYGDNRSSRTNKNSKDTYVELRSDGSANFLGTTEGKKGKIARFSIVTFAMTDEDISYVVNGNEEKTVSGNSINVDSGYSTVYKHNSSKVNKGVAQYLRKELRTVKYNKKAYYLNDLLVIKHGDKPLVEAKDYIVSYKNNVNAGTAKVTIKGIGNYSGSKTITFKIVADTITSPENPADAVYVVKKLNSKKKPFSSAVYSGKSIKPTVKLVKKVGGKEITVPSSMYTVKYSNNVNVGDATVTVTGKKNLKGTLQDSFKITPKTKNGAKVTMSDVGTLKLSGDKRPSPSVKVTVDGRTLKKGVDYTMRVTLNSDARDKTKKKGKAVITISGCGNYDGMLIWKKVDTKR